MFCSACGHELSEQTAYCPHCGKNLTQKSSAKNSHRRLWLILAVIAVLSAGIVFFIYARPSSFHTVDALYRHVSPAVVLIEKYDRNGQKFATGSGFVVSQSGAIATNYHVIRGASSLRIHFASGATADCTGVLGYDADHDVALIATAQHIDSLLVLADSDGVKIGDRVFAIDSPLRLQNSLSDGIISGIRNGILQTTAPVSPGSSGGALINDTGQVIGITTAQVRVTGSENLNFAIPINFIKPYLQNTNLIPLSTLVAENTTTVFKNESLSIPAEQSQTIPIAIGEEQSNAILVGTVDSSGGFGGKIDVRIIGGTGIMYDSGNVTHAMIHQALWPGKYSIVFTNEAFALPRSVRLDLKLSYTH